MASITLTIKTATGRAIADLNKFKQATSQTSKEIRKFSGDVATRQFDRLQAKLKGVQRNFEITGEATKGYRAQQSILRKEIARLLKEEVDRASPRIKALGNQYKALGQQASKASASTRRVGASFSSIAKAAVAIGAAVAVIRRVATAFTASYESARSFTNELKNVSTLTETPIAEFRAQIESLPPILGSATELTQGLYQALSAGVDDADAVMFVGTAAKFAVAGLTDMKSSVDILTTALNAYGLEIEDTNLVSDLFFKTIEQGKISGEELSAVIGKSITLFASARIPLEQLNAGVATLTKVGVDSAVATTQLNGVINSFLKPSGALAEALREQGYAGGAALLETEGLIGAMKFLSEASGENKDELAKLIPNVRGLNAVFALTANGGAEYTSILQEMEGALGSTDKAFSKQVDVIGTLEAAQQYLRETLGKVIETIYRELAPTFQSFTENAIEFLKSFDFSGVVAGLKIFINTLSLVGKFLSSDIVKTAALAFVFYKTAVIGVNAALFLYRNATIAAQIAQLLFNAAMNINPFALLLTGIGLLIVAVVKMVQNWDVTKLRLMQIWEGLKIGFERLAQAFFKSIQFLATPIVALIDGFNALKRALGQDEIRNGLKDFSNNLELNLNNANANVAVARGKIEEYENKIKTLNRLKVEDPFEEVDKKQNTSGQLGYNFDNAAQPPVPTIDTETIAAQQEAALEQLSQTAIKSSDDVTTSLTSDAENIAEAYRATLEQAFENTTSVIDMSLGGTSTVLTGLLATSQMVTNTILDTTKTATQQAIAFSAAATAGVGSLFQGITELFTESFTAQDTENQKLLDEQNKREDATLEKTKERLAAELENKLRNDIDTTSSLADQQAQRASIIKEYENKNTQEEEKSVARKEASEREYERKKDELARQAFETNKANQIAQVGISGAGAIVNAFLTLGPILGGIFSGVIAGVVATQIGVIASKQYTGVGLQTGGDYVVPPGYNDDSYPVRAQSGERVSVTPALDGAKEPMIITINLDGYQIARVNADYVNRGEVVIDGVSR